VSDRIELSYTKQVLPDTFFFFQNNSHKTRFQNKLSPCSISKLLYTNQIYKLLLLITFILLIITILYLLKRHFSGPYGLAQLTMSILLGLTPSPIVCDFEYILFYFIFDNYEKKHIDHIQIYS
jgi:hypothetical protein